MLDLCTIAKALEGDVTGRQVLCPGPGHSPRDRSLSVKPSPDAVDGFVVHSFCGDDWRVCRDHVRDRLGLSRFETPKKAKPLRVRKPDDNKLLKARHLWQCRHPIEGTPAEGYLRTARCYRGPLPGTIGFLEPGVYRWPAMIAAFGLADEPEPGAVCVREVHGIHLTFVKQDSSGKANVERPKMMLGPSNSWPIVVAPPNDCLGLAVTEGIEDALTVHQATGLGVWAAGSAGRMPNLAARVPDYIEAVTIYAHDDDAGQRGARSLADALVTRDVDVCIECPT